MTTIDAIILGVIQGITEFLPISSSGHLVVAQEFFKGFHQPGILFDVMLHAGTLVATCVYFRKELLAIIYSLFSPRKPKLLEGLGDGWRVIMFIIIGSIPTGIIGIAFKEPIERAFSSATFVGFMLLITGSLLWVGEYIASRRQVKKEIGPWTAFWIGLAQGVAITPGISRSGSTIATGLMLGIRGTAAAKFSFLLSIPAILGAITLNIGHINDVSSHEMWTYSIGAIAAFLVGLLAIWVLMRILVKAVLRYFAYYCWVAGLAVILISLGK